MISVITPTYNRKEELTRLYKSLIENNIIGLEWVIVDDGSTDDTEYIVNSWISESQFKIKYIKQENAGKMAALNNGINYITNPYMFEIDSDDYIVPNFFEKVLEDIKLLELKDKEKHKEKYYGIAYLKEVGETLNYFDKNVFKNSVLDINKKNNIKTIKMFDLYNKYLYEGELLILFKTKLRKEFHYDLEDSEKFITEAYLYNKLDRKYDGIYLSNEIGLICEYREDGYTKNIDKLFFQNPKGYLKYYKSNLNMDLTEINFKKKLSFVKNYLFFGYILKKNMFELVKGLDFGIKILIFILYIPGYIKFKIKYKK